MVEMYLSISGLFSSTFKVTKGFLMGKTTSTGSTLRSMTVVDLVY
jgi:hypothetical protein